MKDAFTRFLFYLFIVMVITGPFRSSWPDPAASEPLAAKLMFYVTHYFDGWVFSALLLLLVHSVFTLIRRRRENQPTAELPVPDTGIIYIPPGHENCPECKTDSQIVHRSNVSQ